MARVTVLGGCGAVGSVAVKTLVQSDDFSQVVIADMNIEKAGQMAAAFGGDKVTATACNAHDVQSVKEAIRGSDVVLNCVGPFYLTVKPILAAVGLGYIGFEDVPGWCATRTSTSRTRSTASSTSNSTVRSLTCTSTTRRSWRGSTGQAERDRWRAANTWRRESPSWSR